MRMPALPLGAIYLTRGASKAIAESEQSPGVFLGAYLEADWGDCTEEDWKANDAALRENNRVQAVYHTARGETLWIISESDRSVTTILLPEEY
jgi:hypothetical protein